MGFKLSWSAHSSQELITLLSGEQTFHSWSTQQGVEGELKLHQHVGRAGGQDIILYWGEEELEPRWDGNRWSSGRLREPGEKLGILGTPDSKGIKIK